MKNKIKFRFFIFLLLIFVLNGCAPKELSPEVQNEMNKYGLTKEQVCKGNYYISATKHVSAFSVVTYDNIKCNDFISIERSDLRLGLEFKKFETACNVVNGEIKLDFILRYKKYKEANIPLDSLDNMYSEKTLYCESNTNMRGFEKSNYVFCKDADCSNYVGYKPMTKLYEDSKSVEKFNKKETEKVSQLGDVQSRLKSLGITESDIRNNVSYLPTTMITHGDIDTYLRIKEKEREADNKRVEYEKSLKIQDGKQYICTDGYESWVLKYNGSMIIFGERTFRKNPVYGWYERFMGDQNPVIINRANSTISYSGNKSTCRPR